MSPGFVERYCHDRRFFRGQLLSMVFVNFLAWQEEGMKGVKAPEDEFFSWKKNKKHMIRVVFCQKLGF